MTIHKVIDFISAVVASAFVATMLPDTPLGRIAEGAAILVFLYPVLESLFPPRRYLMFAVTAVGIVALLQLTLGSRVEQVPLIVTVLILASALIGWIMTRRRTREPR